MHKGRPKKLKLAKFSIHKRLTREGGEIVSEASFGAQNITTPGLVIQFMKKQFSYGKIRAS